MEYSIKPSESRDYLVLTVGGEFTAKDMMKCIVETHTLGAEMDIHWYLVDATKGRNIDSVLGNYHFAYKDMKQTEGTDPLARVAALVSLDDHSHDFVATVSANAGMQLQIFTDLDKAIRYLRA